MKANNVPADKYAALGIPSSAAPTGESSSGAFRQLRDGPKSGCREHVEIKAIHYADVTIWQAQ
jgi:hypothetical protein